MVGNGNSKMNRRDFLRMAGMTAGAVALAACAPAGAPGAAAPAAEGGAAAPAAADTVVVEAWAHWEQGLNWIDTALKESGFWEKHPNWSLNKVVLPFAEVHDKLLAATASGVGTPDIARIEQGRMSAFFKTDDVGFVALNDSIGDRMKDLVAGSATDYWTWKGQVYGIGNEVNACTLAYRKSIFDEIGVETPFATWDDFVEASKKLKADKNMAGISFHDLSDGDLQMMLFNAGEQFFLEDGNFGGLNDIGKQILTMQAQMLKDGTAVVAPATGDATWNAPNYWEIYRQDQVAAVLGAPWWNGKLGNDDRIGPGPQEKQWRLQALPGGIGKGIPTATHGGTSVSIPKAAAHKDEAWAIIEESHLTKAVLEDVKERGIVPSYIPAIEDPMVHEPYAFYDGQVIGDLYLDLAKQMPRIFQSPWATDIHTAVTSIIVTPVLQQGADIDKAFEDCAAEIERIKAM